MTPFVPWHVPALRPLHRGTYPRYTVPLLRYGSSLRPPSHGSSRAPATAAWLAQSHAPAAAPWRIPSLLRPPRRGSSGPGPEPPSRGSSSIGSCHVTALPSGCRPAARSAHRVVPQYSPALAVRIIAPAAVLRLLPRSGHRTMAFPVPHSGRHIAARAVCRGTFVRRGVAVP